MQLYPLDPLRAMAALAGMTRPLDRHDFGGRIPDRIGRSVPLPGRLHDLNWGGNDNYLGLCSNLTLVVDGASGADMYNTNLVTTKQLHPLGTMAIAKDGRIFRYAAAGAADLVIGNIVQTAAPIATHLALTSAAQAVGDGVSGKPILVTPGATAGAANLYAEGYLTIDTTPANGYNHKISGHAAITASTLFNLFLDPDDTVQLAFTTATRYGLHHNPWKGVIQTPTTNTALIVGGVVTIITANTVLENYGWLQTRGPFAALINGTPAITSPVANSGTTAGAVDVWTTAAAAVVVTPVGRMMQVGVSGKNNTVFLTID